MGGQKRGERGEVCTHRFVPVKVIAMAVSVALLTPKSHSRTSCTRSNVDSISSNTLLLFISAKDH